jgi:AcrR family transcriptional regulator
MGTRDVILDAALEVIQTKGLARATTKEIARAAGFSEATLYKHFSDKAEIFLGVLRERSPHFMPLMEALGRKAGTGSVEQNLTEVATAAMAFYRHNFAMFASIFSEPELLSAHREGVHKHGAGPHRANEDLAAYLRAE